MTTRVMTADANLVSAPERRRRLHLARRFTSLLVFLIVIVQVYPLVWLFVTSLRPAQEFAGGNAFGAGCCYAGGQRAAYPTWERQREYRKVRHYQGRVERQ